MSALIMVVTKFLKHSFFLKERPDRKVDESLGSLSFSLGRDTSLLSLLLEDVELPSQPEVLYKPFLEVHKSSKLNDIILFESDCS